MKQGKQENEKRWRMCPNDKRGTDYHSCQCSDVEMGLYCLDYVVTDYLESLALHPIKNNMLLIFEREALQQAYRTYPTEEALVKAWTEEGNF